MLKCGEDLADFSVAICTLNRARFLDKCLAGLAKNCAREIAEILVVDNGSIDNTAQVVETYKGRLKVSYAREPKVGLSNARNCALRLVKANYIVFLDDDAIPDVGWLDAINLGIRKYKPDIFGGPFVPYYTAPKPCWFLDAYGSAHLELSEGEVVPVVCFSGGNMGWRVEVLKKLGGFDPRLGMIGDRLRLGEETALQVSLRDWPGLRRVFLPGMSMRHHVAPGKMSLRYIAIRSFSYGTLLHIINPSDDLCAESSFLKALARMRFGLPLIQKLIWRDRDQYPHWKTYAAQYLSLHMILVGVFWGKVSTHALVRNSMWPFGSHL